MEKENQPIQNESKKNDVKALEKTGDNKPETKELKTEFYHQYFNDEKAKTFPPSLLVIQDKNDELLALVKGKGPDGKEKLSFKKIDEALHQDSGYQVELFSNKDILSAVIHNFKAGKNQTHLALDKAYIALNRPIEKVKQWVEARKEVEKEKTKFSDNEIPYSALEKIGIKKGDIEKHTQQLVKGESTELLNVNLKNKNVELKDVPPFNIRLERVDDKIVARLTFKKDNLDIQKDKIGKTLSKEEQLEVLKTGSVVKKDIFNAMQQTSSTTVVWNKNTNVLERKNDVKAVSVFKELETTFGLNLNKDQEKQLGQGKKVQLDAAINPATEKREKAFLSLEKGILKLLFIQEKDLTIGKTKELIER